MNKVLDIPFTLCGIPNLIEVVYKANESAAESGFDALNLPFDPNLCIGYPTMHAYIKNMANTGYRRHCGWIQIIKKEYYSSEALDAPDNVSLVIDTIDPVNIYFAYGYPAEIYDAPCNNLGSNAKGTWTAYTYLVEIPTRMNNNKLSFLAGFSWGYHEALIDNKLDVTIQSINEINSKQWREHTYLMKEHYPQYVFS